MKKFSLLLGCFIFVMACNTSKSPEPEKTPPHVSKNISTASWKTYRYQLHAVEEASYSISYPPDWTADTSGRMNSQFIFTAPVDSAKGGFPENVNLIIQWGVQSPYNDLQKFTLLSIGQFQQNLAGCKVEENTTVKNDSDEYQVVVYSGNYKHADMKVKQVYRIVHDDAYIFTYTAEAKDYDSKIDTVDAMLQSFHYK